MIQPIVDRQKPQARKRGLRITQAKTFRKLVQKHRSESLRTSKGCSLVVLEFPRSAPNRDEKGVAARILRIAGGRRVEVGLMDGDHLGLLLPGVAGTRASRIADTVCEELALVMRKPRYDVYALPPEELARSRRGVFQGKRRFTRYTPPPATGNLSVTMNPPAERGRALSQAWTGTWTDLVDGVAAIPLVPGWKRCLDVETQIKSTLTVTTLFSSNAVLASLNETSLTLSEKVEKGSSAVGFSRSNAALLPSCSESFSRSFSFGFSSMASRIAFCFS